MQSWTVFYFELAQIVRHFETALAFVCSQILFNYDVN